MSLAIAFSENKEDAREYVIKRLKEHGIAVTKDSKLENLVLASTSSENLEKEAERIDRLKQNKKGLLQNFQVINGKDFKNYGTKDFILPSEKNMLLFELMEQIMTDKEFAKFDSDNVVSVGSEMIAAAKAVGLIECIFPPHEPKLRDELFKKATYSLPCDSSVIHAIYGYFGAEVAMYFAFMDHLTIWLIPSGIFGLCIFLYNYLDESVDVDNNLVIPLFSIFMVAWAILFTQYLEQTCSKYACKWGTIGKSGRDVPRLDFEGDIGTSAVTGLREKQYAAYKRIPYYLLSVAVTSVMLFVAFAVMVISLNLQGYITPTAVGAEYLHFPVVYQFAAPGAVFDNQGGGPLPVVLPLLPVVFHAVTIMILNGYYRGIAEWLTVKENHRTDNAYNNSLIVKRILFESFDCYIALFYLAFCKFDIVALRTDLFGLYTTDSLRRVATESLLPWVMHKYKSYTANKDEKDSSKGEPKNKKGNNSSKDAVVLLQEEFFLEEYEGFDDYLEMVIGFGYIVLFSSAFPLASLLTVVCVIIEVRSDIFKLCWVVRRPLPEQVSNIGTWATVLVVMAWLSIVTNTFIFAFTTEQMMTVFPSLFAVTHVGGLEAHEMAAGMGRYVWAMVFLIEHVLFICSAAVTVLVPSMPESIKDELDRLSYVKSQESKQLRKLQSVTGDNKKHKK